MPNVFKESIFAVFCLTTLNVFFTESIVVVFRQTSLFTESIVIVVFRLTSPKFYKRCVSVVLSIKIY
jgi:hypothetical protein